MVERVYLSRRNLQTLLNKLDRVKAGGVSALTLVKMDNRHPIYPQSMNEIDVIAVEDEDYYSERDPGAVLAVDEPNANHK